MTEHIPEPGMEGGIQKEEKTLPEDAPLLADWIEEELGDTELAQFLREHPEGAELCANGSAILPHTVFDVVDDLIDIDHERAKEFAVILAAKELFPQLSYHQGVGNASEEKLADMYLERKYLLAKDRISLRGGEVTKGEHDELYIRTVNNALGRLRVKYGLPAFVVPDEAVRYIPKGNAFTNLSGIKFAASFSLMQQSANFQEQSSPPRRLHDIFHELTHFHSYGSFQADESDNGTPTFDSYRVGLAVIARQNKNTQKPTYLENLNEAVTEETANRLYAEIPEDDPELGKFAEYRKRLTMSLEEDQGTLLVQNRLRSHWVTEAKQEEGGMIIFYSTYVAEKNMMFDMLKKIAERNPEQFDGQSPKEAEEVLFEMLQKAMFTGNILPFGRLFNETFGNGKFREFGHLQTTEEQQAFIEGL